MSKLVKRFLHLLLLVAIKLVASYQSPPTPPSLKANENSETLKFQVQDPAVKDILEPKDSRICTYSFKNFSLGDEGKLTEITKELESLSPGETRKFELHIEESCELPTES